MNEWREMGSQKRAANDRIWVIRRRRVIARIHVSVPWSADLKALPANDVDRADARAQEGRSRPSDEDQYWHERRDTFR